LAFRFFAVGCGLPTVGHLFFPLPSTRHPLPFLRCFVHRRLNVSFKKGLFGGFAGDVLQARMSLFPLLDRQLANYLLPGPHPGTVLPIGMGNKQKHRGGP
jgi:hypothetical protein